MIAVSGSSTWPSTHRSPLAMVALVIVNPETAGCTDVGRISAAKPATRISAARPVTSLSERGVAHLDESDVCVIVCAPVSVGPIPFVGLPQRPTIERCHRMATVANKEASSQLPPYRPADMILPDSDDSEATCRPFRRFSLRVRLRPLTPSTKPSTRNSRRWRLLQPLIAQPVVGWTSGLDRRV